MSEDVVRELITRETIASVGERIFKSQKTKLSWQFPMGFKYGGHMIEAKVLPDEWLNRFQNNQEPVFPGDSLRVSLRDEVSYGYDNKIVHTDYEVEQVVEVIRGLRWVEDSML